MEVAAKIALETKVIDVLKTCYDPEIPTNIYDLGLIYEINIDDEANVHTIMTLTSPSCPVAETLPPEVEEKIRNIPGLSSSKVEITWDPQWSMDMMSEAAKLELNMF
ncbi:MAG: FeS assembly SUF system protein [Cyclobacteriaceae bacterium]|jgi:FeS assembly SUF system protein